MDGARDARRPTRRRRLKVALALLGAVVAAWLVVWFVLVPYPWTLRTRNPERTALMEQREEEARLAGSTLEITQRWTPLEEISSTLVRAVLVAEDYRFRQHEGVDWVSLAEEVRWSGDEDFSWTSPSDLAALRRAVAYVWSNRDDIRGRSTITQQLAKNLYYGTDRSLHRKAMEFVVARRLERRLGKDRILELYLNVAEWGPGLFGAEAAARHYFGRSAASLSLDQAAALAATLPHPLTSNPAHRPSRMLWRKDLILQRLDPASGIPPAPLPLPEPEIELGGEAQADLFEPDLPLESDSLQRVPEAPADSTAPTQSAEPEGADADPVDTLHIRPDTVMVRSTIRGAALKSPRPVAAPVGTARTNSTSCGS